MRACKIVEPDKARSMNPFYQEDECTPSYVDTGETVSVLVESREMEIAIIKAYDYGIDSLTPLGKKQIQRFVDYALLRMKGKL